jgi:hypothetical protein
MATPNPCSALDLNGQHVSRPNHVQPPAAFRVELVLKPRLFYACCAELVEE